MRPPLSPYGVRETPLQKPSRRWYGSPWISVHRYPREKVIEMGPVYVPIVDAGTGEERVLRGFASRSSGYPTEVIETMKALGGQPSKEGVESLADTERFHALGKPVADPEEGERALDILTVVAAIVVAAFITYLLTAGS